MTVHDELERLIGWEPEENQLAVWASRGRDLFALVVLPMTATDADGEWHRDRMVSRFGSADLVHMERYHREVAGRIKHHGLDGVMCWCDECGRVER